MSNCRRGLATDSGDRGLDESLVQQFPGPSIHAARGSVSGWHTDMLSYYAFENFYWPLWEVRNYVSEYAHNDREFLIFGIRGWRTWLSLIIICLNKLSSACSHRVMKGSHDCEQYPKRLLLLMKAWILFIVWDVVSTPEFLWLWANPKSLTNNNMQMTPKFSSLYQKVTPRTG